VEIEAPGPSGPLKGSWLQAAQPTAPVVLIIPGSGPTDRDGNSPAGIKAAPYRMLAEALAAKGVSSARWTSAACSAAQRRAIRMPPACAAIPTISARGCGRSGSAAGALHLGARPQRRRADGAGDSREQRRGHLRHNSSLRHGSEARRRAARTAAASPPFAPHLDKALAALAQLEAGQRVDTAGMDPVLLSLFAPQVQGFMLDVLGRDPAELAAKVRVPMLVVQGLKDLQTSEADARRIAAANPAARLVLLPGVNHVLKAVEGDDRGANIATYGDPSRPLAPGVAEAIAHFVRR
jgi:hypothetical protein